LDSKDLVLGTILNTIEMLIGYRDHYNYN